MGLDFRYVRTVLIADVPEDDPNTTEPPAAAIFRLRDRLPSGNLLTTGMNLYGEFSGGAPGANASWDFVVWMRDTHPTGVWTPLPKRKKLPHLETWPTDETRDADVFVQVIGVGGVGVATDLILHATER